MPTGRKHHLTSLTVHAPACRRLAVLGATMVAMVAVLTGSSLAVPAPPEPTLDEVKVEVENLYHEMEVAAEAYNDATVTADEVRGRLATLRTNLSGLRRDLADATAAVGSFASAEYRAAGLDPVMEMMLEADDGVLFLHSLSQLDQLADQRATAVGDLTRARAAVALQENSIRRETGRLDAISTILETASATADAKHRAAQVLLDRLTAEEEARLAAEAAAAAAAEAEAAAVAAAWAAAVAAAAADSSRPTTPTGLRAAIAVNYGLAQIGDAYVWGGVGPDSYDCSGLTMMAWAAAGVSLPHSALAQNGYGTQVSVTDLQPGDLVFYYTPISHVAMYIGNGQIVHASNPSRPVGIGQLTSMPISGMRRIG